MSTTETLCTCPVGDNELAVHFYGCGDQSWFAEDAAPSTGSAA